MSPLSASLVLILELYSFVVLARVLMSWLNPNPYNPVIRAIFNMTEPVLKPIRELLPPVSGFDFSPLILLVALQVLGQFLASMLG